MDASRNELLGSLARDAALERGDFLVQATEQLKRFLEANSDRISEVGGLTLIDDDPDYLSVAPDLTFRSRSRYLDEATGEWTSETEVIESASELVELYNPADIYSAFADSAREAAGLAPEPTAADDLLGAAGIPASDSVRLDDAYAAAADEWAAAADTTAEPEDEESAAQRLYDLSLTYQERSQRSEARLLDDFADVATRLSAKVGDLVVVDDDDERLVLKAGGGFRAEVVPDDADGKWKSLSTADQIVEFYDPTDVFGDLADAIAEAFPFVAAEDELATPASDEAGEGDDEEDGEGEDDEADDEDGEDATDAHGTAGAGDRGPAGA